MSELAFNMNGEPFDVPANAAGWRVRRMKNKGAPEVVYGRNGVPLVLPLDADIEDLRHEAGAAGRYRLDPVDDSNRPISSAPAGYVFVHDERPAPSETRPAPAAVPSGDSIVIEALRMNAEAMRMNAEIARSVVDRFPQMLEGAAALLHAADGAGLPARAPRGDEDDDHDDASHPPAPPPGLDLSALVAQLVPLAMAALGNGNVKLPGLAELLDWRKAAPSTTPARAKTAKPAPTSATSDAATETADGADALPPIDAQTMAHIVAVQAVLTAEERTIALEVAKELSPAERRAWFEELSKLGVPEAVEKIRTLIKGDGSNGASTSGGAS